jgi:hypothetical protein
VNPPLGEVSPEADRDSGTDRANGSGDLGGIVTLRLSFGDTQINCSHHNKHDS